MYWTKLHQTAWLFSNEKRKQRQMGMLLTIIGIIFLLLKYELNRIEWYQVTFCCLPAAVGWLLPKLILPILYVWMLVGQMIGDLISTVIISSIYLLIITPVSIFIKKKKRKGWEPKKSSNIDLEKMY